MGEVSMKKFFGWVLALGLLAAPLALTQRAQAQDDSGYYGGDYGYDSGYDPGYAYGAAPVCQWGYYNYYPYSCAPYGFYGPAGSSVGSLSAPARGTTATGDMDTGVAVAT